MMKILKHTSASASHYNQEAEHYDEFNEKNSQTINQVLQETLKKYGVHSVLDLTCGTGSQVFYLLDAGFDVVGVDINTSMLNLAKQKAGDRNISFLEGDMRTIQVGEFDAVMTIFNAIGHLTRDDFEKAMRNIHKNLKQDGFYIFDIFNVNYLRHDHNISKLTIDWLAISGNTHVREVQFSCVDKDGVLASYSTYFKQEGFDQPIEISQRYNTLQCYTADELKMMLECSGFQVIEQLDVNGVAFSDIGTERCLTIARKI